MIKHIMFTLFLVISPFSFAEEREIDIEEFRELLSLPMGTMKYTETIGIEGGKACIALHQMSKITKKWSENVYCVKASKLSETELNTLKQATKE